MHSSLGLFCGGHGFVGDVGAVGGGGDVWMSGMAFL